MLPATLLMSINMLLMFYLLYEIFVLIHMYIFIKVRTCKFWLDLKLPSQCNRDVFVAGCYGMLMVSYLLFWATCWFHFYFFALPDSWIWDC